MNTKIIIYDDSCPLCAAYTNAFVQTGLIEKEGRKNFSSISLDLSEKIDLKRSANEIPVVDTATGQVWYGIDALLEILQQKIPFAKKAGNVQPIKWLLQKMYKFISYNRRVIVAAASKPGSFDCTPDFNTPYRLAFLCCFLAINTMLLFPLHKLVFSNSLFYHTTIQQLQGIHGAIVLLNIFIAAQLKKKDALEYLGQINMLVVTILLLLIPIMLLNKFTYVTNSNIDSFYLGAMALFAIKEYTRRMQFIGFFKKYPAVILINAISCITFIIYLIL